MTAPGDLGFARAIRVGRPRGRRRPPRATPTTCMVPCMSRLQLQGADAGRDACRSSAASASATSSRPPPPPEEHLPRWRRALEGLRHTKARDAEAIHHHYDVSNRFYELVLGPSMTYTCAVFPTRGRHAWRRRSSRSTTCRAQARPQGRRPSARRRLRLGRHGPPRRAALRRQGPRRHAVARAGRVGAGGDQARRASTDLAEVRYSDYRDVTETGFDAVSSIGLTEHIGVKQLRRRTSPSCAAGSRSAAACSTTASPAATAP